MDNFVVTFARGFGTGEMCIRDRIMSKTSFGNKVYLVGTNAKSAKFAGINVKKTTLCCYMTVSYTHLDVYKRQVHWNQF